MQKHTKNVLKTILKTLAEAKLSGEGFLWIREISRRTKLNPATVTWSIHRYLSDKVEFMSVDPLIEKGLKIQPIRIKEEALQEILKKQENRLNNKKHP